jgi:hypothetical protein
LSPALPSGIEQAFEVAAGELGMCSAAWLFVREVAAEGGDPLVRELRDRLGRAFPVLDTVCSVWASGRTAPQVDPAGVLLACAGATRVVVVGIESAFLDQLVPRLEGVRLALLCHSAFHVDWDRALANYEGLEPVNLDSFQGWAGPKSALLTFAYGVARASAHILPAWLRVVGEDVRTQFRSLIAWDVLGAQMYVYPRWLVEVPASSFTHIR